MWGSGWWIVGLFVMVACMILMGRMMMGHGGSDHGHGASEHDAHTTNASEVLAERFARGEISEEEFVHRKQVLEKKL